MSDTPQDTQHTAPLSISDMARADGYTLYPVGTVRPAAASHVTLPEYIAALRSALASARRDGERLEWWFAAGLDESVCDGSVDLWWADGEAEVERVTHGTSLRDTLDKAMRGAHEDRVCVACGVHIGSSAEGADGRCVNCAASTEGTTDGR